MPQGVEHSKRHEISFRTHRLAKPLMPQGVEHTYEDWELSAQEELPKPLMPQKALSTRSVFPELRGLRSAKPLMPQGVEHMSNFQRKDIVFVLPNH